MLEPGDVVELLNEVALLNLLFALTLAAVAVFYRRGTYVWCWSLVFVSATINATVNNNSDWFSQTTHYWSTVNLTSIVTMTFTVAGWRLRESRTAVPIRLMLFLVMAWLLTAVFTLGWYHRGLNMFFIPLASFVTVTAVIRLLLEKRKERGRLTLLEYGAIPIMGVHGLAQLLAGLVALIQGAAADPVVLGYYSTINFYTFLPTFVTMGVLTVAIAVNDGRNQSSTGAQAELTGR